MRRGGDHEKVDVSADVGAVVQVLLLAAEELEQEAALDPLVPADRGRQRACDRLEYVLPLRLTPRARSVNCTLRGLTADTVSGY